jgi:hypothetical protein
MTVTRMTARADNMKGMIAWYRREYSMRLGDVFFFLNVSFLLIWKSIYTEFVIQTKL